MECSSTTALLLLEGAVYVSRHLFNKSEGNPSLDSGTARILSARLSFQFLYLYFPSFVCRIDFVLGLKV